MADPQLSAAQKKSQLTEAGIPDPLDFRRARPVGGLFAQAAVLDEIDPVVVLTPIAGALAIRLRGKLTHAGTLSFAYRRSPPNQDTAYDATLDGPHADVVVIANTEFVVDIEPGGESLLAITWVGDGVNDAVVTFFDIMQQ